jgi:hypothetical protein
MARENRIFHSYTFTFNALALYDFLMTSGGQAVVEGIGRRNGSFISLKNGSFKEPLLSVHFVYAWGISYSRALFLLQECEGATHYETANG